MGWGLDFSTDIFLSRCTLTTTFAVQDKIDSNKTDIEGVNAKLKMFAIASIAEILPEQWEEEPVNWIDSQINQLLEDRDELLIENYKLSLYLDYLEDKDKIDEKDSE